MSPELAADFWAQVAVSWCRRLSSEQRQAIATQVESGVARSLQELEADETEAKIPTALDAILSDDDDDEDDW